MHLQGSSVKLNYKLYRTNLYCAFDESFQLRIMRNEKKIIQLFHFQQKEIHSGSIHINNYNLSVNMFPEFVIHVINLREN